MVAHSDQTVYYYLRFFTVINYYDDEILFKFNEFAPQRLQILHFLSFNNKKDKDHARRHFVLTSQEKVRREIGD